jgi:hypothetical protein
VSQLLFSFATYMHDAYLPVYLQDVLGLSNTKVGPARHCQCLLDAADLS